MLNKRNSINNPINNPINNQKRRAARRAEYEKYFHDNMPAHMSVMLCEKEVKLRAQQIILCPLKCSTDGLTLQQIALNESICFYVGTTKQHDIELEDLRWLTERGTTPCKSKQNKKKKYLKTGRCWIWRRNTGKDWWGWTRHAMTSALFLNACSSPRIFLTLQELKKQFSDNFSISNWATAFGDTLPKGSQRTKEIFTTTASTKFLSRYPRKRGQIKT